MSYQETTTLTSAYKHPSGIRLEIHRADAFDIPADMLLFGKTAALRERIEQTAGKAFEAYAPGAFPRATTPCGRPLTAVRSDRLPWPLAVSMRYHPRNGPLDAMAITPPHMPHVWKLFFDLDFLLNTFGGQHGAERVLFLPFSWRNPRVIALATVGAICHYSQHRRRTQLLVRRSMWNEAAAEHNAEWLAELSRPRCFMIADLSDPSPYEEVLANRGELVRRAMHLEDRGSFVPERRWGTG